MVSADFRIIYGSKSEEILVDEEDYSSLNFKEK